MRATGRRAVTRRWLRKTRAPPIHFQSYPMPQLSSELLPLALHGAERREPARPPTAPNALRHSNRLVFQSQCRGWCCSAPPVGARTHNNGSKRLARRQVYFIERRFRDRDGGRVMGFFLCHCALTDSELAIIYCAELAPRQPLLFYSRWCGQAVGRCRWRCSQSGAARPLSNGF